MTDKTEKNYIGDVVRQEMSNYQSRKEVTILSGAGVLVAGTILAQVLLAGTAVSAAKAGGNTGGGTCTPDVATPVLDGAVAGVYKVRCGTLVANGGVFEVVDPNGASLGEAIAGVAFSNQIKFVLADVGTDFAIGDGFDITVAAGSLKYQKAVSGAVNGTQTGAAILLEDVDATDADVTEALVLVREAQVSLGGLTYDASADDDNKKAALRAGLEAANVQFLTAA